MNNEEILKKAINKAICNGYLSNIQSSKNFELKACEGNAHEYWEDEFIVLGSTKDIIFSHSFAKAFWGEEVLFQGGITVDEYIEDWVKKNSGRGKYKPQEALKIAKNDIAYWTKHKQLREAWAWHLQQMVLEENPLEYLAKFLKGK